MNYLFPPKSIRDDFPQTDTSFPNNGKLIECKCGIFILESEKLEHMKTQDHKTEMKLIVKNQPNGPKSDRLFTASEVEDIVNSVNDKNKLEKEQRRLKGDHHCVHDNIIIDVGYNDKTLFVSGETSKYTELFKELKGQKTHIPGIWIIPRDSLGSIEYLKDRIHVRNMQLYRRSMGIDGREKLIIPDLKR